MGNLRKVNILGMCLIIALGLTMPASAQEKKVTKKDVPVAVVSAFQKAYPKATIKGYSTEVEEGKSYYEVESVEGKTSRDVLYLADGTVAEVEEGVDATGLPAPVKDAVSAKYPKGEIVKAEKSTRGSAVTYELKVAVEKTRMGLVVDPSGKIIKESKASAKKVEKKGKD